MRVCWEAPLNSSVSYYLINASSLNYTGRDLVTNTSSNATFFNVTGLDPGTTYELTVVAVSQGGDVIASKLVNLWYAQLDLQVSATFNIYSVTVFSKCM